MRARLEDVDIPPYPAPFTVLQIDDLDSNLLLVERLLENRGGIRVLSADSGLSGLSIARNEQPDLILLDVMMPHMGGDEVLDRLKGDPCTAQIPVVVFSGNRREGVVESMLDAGAESFLPKPFTVESLYAVVDSFRKPAKRRQVSEYP